MMKIKNIKEFLREKPKLSSFLTILLFTFLLLMLFTFTLMPKNYPSRVFSSDMVNLDKGIYHVEDKNDYGIFTYGPYINLEKGKYEVVIHYSSDRDRPLQFTADYGARMIGDVLLPKGENTKASFELEIKSAVTDSSFEMRTVYNGNGSLSLYGASVRNKNINFFFLFYILSFVSVAVFSLFLFKGQEKLRYLYLLYTGILYLLLFPSLGRTVYGTVTVALLFAVVAFSIKQKPKEATDTIFSKGFYKEVLWGGFASYVTACTCTLFTVKGSINTMDFVTGVDLNGVILTTLLFFNFIIMLRVLVFKKHFIYICAQVSALVFALVLISRLEQNIYLTTGICLITFFITYSLCKQNKTGVANLNINPYVSKGIVIFFYLLFVYLFTVATVSRYRSFDSANFDFGIFAQMYENMAKTGLPVTTVERNRLLSHFCIHFSPIYYVFLPVYALFRNPEVLLFLQAAIVGAGVFPFYGLCSDFEGKGNKNYTLITLASLTYLAFPAIGAPLFYDFHENAFLPFCILWLLWAVNKNKKILSYVFLFLTLFIKEDAAVYTCAIALYIIFAKKRYKQGSLFLILSLMYFSIVIYVMSYFERSLMNSHYAMYYLSGEKGVMTMFKNIFMNPGFVFKVCFTQENMTFILYTLGPLAFLPLSMRKPQRLWLLLPMVVMNLATDYVYQHDVGYQYVWGSAPLLLYLFVQNIREKKTHLRYALSITCLVASLCAFYTYKGDVNYFINKYNSELSLINEDDKLLKRIPENAEVTASTFLVPHLYKCSKLYEFESYNGPKTEYYVLSSELASPDTSDIRKELLSSGYKISAYTQRIYVFKKEDK